jgi:hypothetical protein
MVTRLLCRLRGHDDRFYYHKDIGIVWSKCVRCGAWRYA